jgi:hypothetical protein
MQATMARSEPSDNADEQVRIVTSSFDSSRRDAQAPMDSRLSDMPEIQQ